MSLHQSPATEEVKASESLSSTLIMPSISIEDLTTDVKMHDAFRMFGCTKPSIDDMARFVGFKGNDIKMATLFMSPDFDDSWFYLSPEYIMGDIGYNSAADFYKALRVSYKEGIEFKVICTDDPLIKTWDSIRSQLLMNQESPNLGNRARPHAVKGETLKDVLQRANTVKAKQVRGYYRLVEKLAIFMHNYGSLVDQFTSEQKRIKVEQQLIEQSKRLIALETQTKDLDQRAELLKQFIRARAIRRPTGYLYIATTHADHAVNRFKIGITTNLEIRLGVYNKTFTNANSKVYFCDYFCIHDHAIVEKLVSIYLKPYHLVSAERVKQDESYILNLTRIHATIANICAQHMLMIDAGNEQLGAFEADIHLPSPAMRRNLPETQLAIDMDAIGFAVGNLTDPSPADEKILCDYVIGKLVRARNYPTFNWPVDKDEELATPVQLKWEDISKCVKEKLPRGQKIMFTADVWKSRFRATLAGARSIVFKANATRAPVI